MFYLLLPTFDVFVREPESKLGFMKLVEAEERSLPRAVKARLSVKLLTLGWVSYLLKLNKASFVLAIRSSGW